MEIKQKEKKLTKDRIYAMLTFASFQNHLELQISLHKI
jgi:hypothetical protein